MPWVKNLCRFCGQIGEICFNIISPEPNYNLQQKIKKCLNVEICKEDFKPKEICSLCCSKLNDFSNFLDVCYATNIKFETIYYTEPWHQNLSDRLLCNNLSQKPHSVIVSNKQVYENLQPYTGSHETSIMVLQHYSLSTSNNIVDFNDTCTNNHTQYSECRHFQKTEHLENIKKRACLLNESDPNELPTYENTGISSNLQNKVKCTLSVEEVKKSLKSQQIMVNTNKCLLKPPKLYPCPHCEKSFMRRSNLNAHIASHTKIKPFKCSVCSKTFAVKCHLTQHNKLHSDEFQCRVCFKNFDVPSKLSRHLRTHTNEKPYNCSFPQCTKTFADNNNLKYHSLTHLNDKQFSCDVCKKLFKSKKNLQTHIKTHASNAMFNCKFCQKGFKYKHNLKNHLVKHETEKISNDYRGTELFVERN